MVIPTHQRGPEARQNPIRFKNALTDAEQRLQEVGFRQPEIETYLGPLRELIDNESFWNHQYQALAIFVDQESDDGWLVRLPFHTQQATLVSQHWYLRPLFPLMQQHDAAWLLALSRGQVRLWFATPHYMIEHTLPADTPTSLQDLDIEMREHKSLQFHTKTSQQRGKRGAIHHGGLDDNTDDAHITLFCRRVSEALQPIWAGSEHPLLVVAEEGLAPIYTKHETYRHLHPEPNLLHPDGVNESRLLQEVESFLNDRRHQRLQQLQETLSLAQQNSRVAFQLPSILLKSFHGKTDVLWLSQDQQRWGDFQPDERTTVIRTHPEANDDELLNLAGIYTLRNSGTVQSVAADTMPDVENSHQSSPPAVALLRY